MRCPDCGKTLYRRKVGGKWEQVHLLYPGSKGEAITICRENKLSKMLRIG